VAELAELAHDRCLAALEVADEVPAEGVAVGVVLHLQVLRAVLPHHLDAGLGQRRQVLERDVLRRRDDRDPGSDLLADALVALADLSR
jgi:hypothetical protein